MTRGWCWPTSTLVCCICSPFRVTDKMLQADDEIERLHEEEMKLIREASGDLVKIDDDEKEDEEDM